LYISIFTFLDKSQEDTDSEVNANQQQHRLNQKKSFLNVILEILLKMLLEFVLLGLLQSEIT
jgi:hypothetical protein